MHKTFGQIIHDLRDQKDFSLRELSDKIGVSPAFLSDIELGRRSPREDILEKIAHALGVKVEFLKDFDQREAITGIKERMSADPSLVPLFRKMAKRDDLADQLRRITDKDKEK